MLVLGGQSLLFSVPPFSAAVVQGVPQVSAVFLLSLEHHLYRAWGVTLDVASLGDWPSFEGCEDLTMGLRPGPHIQQSLYPRPK